MSLKVASLGVRAPAGQVIGSTGSAVGWMAGGSGGGGLAAMALNADDGKWYPVEARTLDDGTVAPACGQTGQASAPEPAVPNPDDGESYPLQAKTLDDGTVVPVCDQTPV